MFGTLLAVLSFPSLAKAEKVRIAVASNFIATMVPLMAEYEKQSEDALIVSYGSSGKIFAQISRGAPFDIFLSADQHKPRKLQEAGIVASENRFTYAIGSLVLWSRDTQLLIKSGDLTSATISNIALDELTLDSLDFHKLAIANPRTAPYGVAAQETLTNIDAITQIKSKLVTGENIAQAFMFVKTGNAQLGFIARSQLLQLPEHSQGSYWDVPESLHSPIKQDAVLLNGASLAANKFFVFLQSESARNIIQSSGYRIDSSGYNFKSKEKAKAGS